MANLVDLPEETPACPNAESYALSTTRQGRGVCALIELSGQFHSASAIDGENGERPALVEVALSKRSDTDPAECMEFLLSFDRRIEHSAVVVSQRRGTSSTRCRPERDF